MKGYCSNSPLRCSLAESCDIIESEDHCCSKCLKALILTDNQEEEIARVTHILLKVILVIGISLTLLSVMLFCFEILPSFGIS